MLDFIQNVTQRFNMSSLKTNVGVLTFNDEVHIQTELTAEREVLKKAIQNVKNFCCRGLAYTNLAFNAASKVFQNSSRNITTTKAAILLTDSSCNNKNPCPESVVNRTQRLYNGGINIIIVDISKNVDQELETAASGTGNLYIRVDTFSELDNENVVSTIASQMNQGISFVIYV